MTNDRIGPFLGKGFVVRVGVNTEVQNMTLQNGVALMMALSLTLSALIAAESEAGGSLAECQRLKDKISYYTNKRRAGGSSRQMQTWKDQRQVTQRAFKQHRCARYGARLN